MLLADLGADVVKVEPPRGDEWRRYDPFEEGESRYFYALNRGKRSVALDLKTEEGRARSRELIADGGRARPQLPARAGAPLRPRRRERAAPSNPRCVAVCVSAFGSSGPDAERPAYDLIGQALSGLLLADPRAGRRRAAARPAGSRSPTSPPGCSRRWRWRPGCSGAASARRRWRCRCSAPRSRSRHSASWRWTAATTRAAGAFATARTWSAAGRWRRSRRSTPTTARTPAPTASWRSPVSTPDQRRQVCELLGLEDPYAANPQAEPRDAAERERPAGARARRRGGLRAAGGARGRGGAGRARGAGERGARRSGSSSTTSRCARTASSRRSSSRAWARCGCSAACSRSTAQRRGAAARRRALDEHADELLGAPSR